MFEFKLTEENNYEKIVDSIFIKEKEICRVPNFSLRLFASSLSIHKKDTDEWDGIELKYLWDMLRSRI